MRKTACCIMTILVCCSAYAIKTGAFRSLDEITEAAVIMIVKVPVSQGDTVGVQRGDGIIDYEVEIVDGIKGAPGKAGDRIGISTPQTLAPGACYLMAGPSGSIATAKPRMLFHWDLGVVRLPKLFDLRTLEGKTPQEQVTTLLAARRDEIDKETQVLEREKKQIEDILNGQK